MAYQFYEYQGIKGIPAIAKHVGISAPVINYRIHKLGKTLEQAIAMGKGKKLPFKYEYKGFKGMKNIAEAFGIQQQTLENRVKRDGMTIEDAISKNVRPRAANRCLSAAKPSHWQLALGQGGNDANTN